MTKIFEITKDSLKVAISKPFGSYHEDIPFENINHRIIRQKNVDMFFLIPAILCLFGLIITIISHLTEINGSSIYDILFYGIPTFVLVIALIFTFNNLTHLYLYDNRRVTFYGVTPNKKAVEDFIEDIFQSQKIFLLNRYAKADPYVSHDQMGANLKWLWDRKIINDEELNKLRIELLPPPNASNVVGFKFNSNIN